MAQRVGRTRRFALAALAALVVLPIALVAPLIVFQPPTTAVMLRRAAERLANGQRPIYPQRDIVSRDEISPHLRRAVLAAEDDRFYLHHGLAFTEIERPLDRQERGGRLRGASTISQQTVKNIFLWEGRSWVRKGLEAWLTVALELCLTKDRILDVYLNLAEWGDGVFGAEMAAQTHFGKPASRLTRDEAARLAAILPSPRRWSPQGAAATRRARTIAARMRFPAPREEG